MLARRPFKLVLPCYNESRSLPALFQRAVGSARRRGLGADRFQLFLVENGSRDDSLAVMEALGAGPDGAFLRVVPVPVNRGYGHGLMCGLRAAGDGVLGFSHADEQCDPEDAFRAHDLLVSVDDPRLLVKGRRVGRAVRDAVVSRGFELAAALVLGRRLHEINAQPKVFPGELLALLSDPPDDFAFDLYLLLKAREAGYRIRDIEVRFPPRAHGQSNWSSTLRSRSRTMGHLLGYMAAYRTRSLLGRTR
jgi:glycosyltransferase involved in cell wall biosynthesis